MTSERTLFEGKRVRHPERRVQVRRCGLRVAQ
jgi:hypothetical protein